MIKYPICFYKNSCLYEGNNTKFDFFYKIDGEKVISAIIYLNCWEYPYIKGFCDGICCSNMYLTYTYHIPQHVPCDMYTLLYIGASKLIFLTLAINRAF
jgi:hypothetical protein